MRKRTKYSAKILICSDVRAANLIADGLTALGCPARVYREDEYPLGDGRASRRVIVCAPPPQRALAAAGDIVRIRPDALLICVGYDQHLGTRLLLAGADSWMPLPESDLLVFAMLQALDRLLRRRAGQDAADDRGLPAATARALRLGAARQRPAGNATGAAGAWCLSKNNALIAPDGAGVVLSAQEARLIRGFLRSRDHIVMKGDREIFGGHALAARSTALMISRLRAKFRRLGAELPIKSLYGIGYRFHAPLEGEA
ncbi:helix-turn-helix domain-containing protein [Bordetella petrii]|uniref:OmpR/PhoB-type domain-containing protein n=1 Tax=Bordetella petrii TaxID=94624 RepID=A0ABT7W417_9BORD|nr:hypothetical protein [Bordetella petrii]MDM9559934.1 hypothetical protein [Bordetella petrii]